MQRRGGGRGTVCGTGSRNVIMSKPVSARKWRQRSDPLWRGDVAGGASLPTPGAKRSIVRHVLFLDGAGRDTPYHSTSQSETVAERFARSVGGRTYQTTVARAHSQNVMHIGHLELLALLRGKGRGDAEWPSAAEVAQARRYVEQALEHLLDFGRFSTRSPRDLVAALAQLYT
jgi:hypothetical protein